ncbi:ATP-binding protein [Arthrobacter subterraneus]|uniref:ATP-binding protein n=1 Tax=Arthrobacter subterraneus TaxID=335973 RepID=UPI0038197001
MSTETLPGLEFEDGTAPQDDAAASERTLPGQWRLDGVELVNWGTFQGHHTVDVAREGFLITGHSGSGKSSLLDGIAAVLTPRKWLRFNAAAQDASSRGEDRSIVSYIRGAWRRQADEVTGEVASDHLRPGATWSGILLRYRNGRSENPVILVKLYHLKRGSNSPSEVSELHILLQQDASLPDFQEFARNGLEPRRIKAAWPEAGIVTDQHSSFARRFRSVLGIASDNALLLLHKTQSAKSLGNLDELFRNFMLDEPATFRLAKTAVEQFSELAEAHRLVVDARRQVEHLQPLVPLCRQYEEGTGVIEHAARLRHALEPFKDAWKLRLALQEKETAEHGLKIAQAELNLAASAIEEAEQAHALARTHVESSGGQALAQQREWVSLAEAKEQEVRRRQADLEQELGSVGITFPASLHEFEELRSAAEQERAELESARARGDKQLDELRSARTDLARRRDALTGDIRALRQQSSNMDRRNLQARQKIAQATGLPTSSLPFVAELLQVRTSEAAWTGALERVLKPLATIMLVPSVHETAVSAAMNSMDLGTRMVVEVVGPRVEDPRTARSDRSLIHKLEVREGTMAAWIHSQLSRLYDYECVEDPADLKPLEKGVTLAGQVKRSRTRYEKDDRHRLDDREFWILGFDNEAKVEHLIRLLQDTVRDLEAANREVQKAERMREAALDRVRALESLRHRSWDDVDVAAAEEHRRLQLQRLESLRAASSDLRRAEKDQQNAAERLRAAKEHETAKRTVVADEHSRLKELDRVISELTAEARTPVQDADAEELEQRFHGVRRSITHAEIDGVALRVSGALTEEENAARKSVQTAEQSITAIQFAFVASWRAVAGDLTAEITDRGGFLDILGKLRADRLPDFEQKFFDLLESQAQRNVGQLANEIRRAPGQIRERIDPVNRSLRRSPFDQGRYLKIMVKDNNSDAKTKFMQDLQTISSGSWAEESREAAEQKFDVMNRLMTRLSSSEAGDRAWQRQVLDTRQHVRFTGMELDEAGTTVNIHDSSAGLSGGQRQKLVIFCLAAALRYQLAEDEDDIPGYGTVILDEAFDKADSAFTRMAMNVFLEFGFHMVLATPLKLLQTLEDYVGGIALVVCRDFRDSRVGVVSIGDGELTEAAGEPADGSGA